MLIKKYKVGRSLRINNLRYFLLGRLIYQHYKGTTYISHTQIKYVKFSNKNK